eukprot:jgi/Astpho2/6948/e_gw1.00107.204.1_t
MRSIQVAAASAKISQTADFSAHSWDEEPESSGLGPAARSTMQVLEWPLLCSYVARFASTTLGSRAASTLHLPEAQVRPHANPCSDEQLVRDTAALVALESDYAVSLDFGGTSTQQASQALKRASRGGMLTGLQLASISSLLIGASRLKRAIQGAVRSAEDSGASATFEPLVDAIKELQPHEDILTHVAACVAEDGAVKDTASEEVRRTRGQLSSIEGRLNSILKGYGGEVTEHSGRLCVVVPAGDDGPPKGILLGASTGNLAVCDAGGSAYYMEPPAAVALNNERGAARSQVITAEENVLWWLTGLIIDSAPSLEHALEMVVWLDVAAARARFGEWIEGALPSFLKHPTRGKLSARARRKGPKGRDTGEDSGVDAEGVVRDATGQLLSVRMQQLRHPLLLARHLDARDKQRQQRQRQQTGTQTRHLSNRKQVTHTGGTGAAGVAQSDVQPAPVPIDVQLRPDVRAMIITGPNTGGKTATLKSFGLAVLMAKAGLAVPAAAPVALPCYGSVLADIGDEQSLSASLSTFSGHLRRIEAIRRESDSRALVLLDEVGTGTDPGEGAALGVALLHALIRGGFGGASFTMATTHHSSLTALKYKDPSFENASVEFDEVKLAPTYRLVIGVPGKSNALNIASRLGMDAGIIEAARTRLGSSQVCC